LPAEDCGTITRQWGRLCELETINSQITADVRYIVTIRWDWMELLPG